MNSTGSGIFCVKSGPGSDRTGVECWHIPDSVELRDDRIYWAFREGICRQPDPGLIGEFTSLSKKGKRGILEFARKWGVLLLCRHGLPASHTKPLPESPEVFSPCEPLGWDEEERCGYEPLDLWYLFSTEASAILRITSSLLYNLSVDARDRDTLERAVRRLNLTKGKGLGDPGNPLSLKSWTGQVISEWLRLGGINPCFAWNLQGASFKLTGGHSLFGAIAQQLLNAVFQSEGLVTCFECGNTFHPRRKPQRGRRIFCTPCRHEGAPLKWASRDYRARRKS